jgi:hypothetical protein
MLTINNAGARDYCSLASNKLATAVTFAVNGTTGVITFTDATVYPTGDGRASVNVTLYDRFGNKAELHFEGATTSGTINPATAGLNKSEGLDAIVTVVSTLNKRKDGSVYDITTFKQSGNFVMQY